MTRTTIRIASAVGLVLMWVAVATSTAQAGGRKRVVVLGLSGPKAEKFHDDIEKIIQKKHTIVPLDKWNMIAEELDAAKGGEKNFKKIAKKLKIDGIVEGRVEKRREEYILRLKLREGKTGEVVGNPVDTKAEGPRIDGKAQRDITDELVEQINQLESNRGGGGGGSDEDEDKPSAKKKVAAKEDDDEDKPPAKKGAKAAPAKKEDPKKAAPKKDDDDEDEGKPMAKKGAKAAPAKKEDPKKAAAKKDDDDDDEGKPMAKKGAAVKAAPVKKEDPKKAAAKKDDEDDEKAALKTKKDDDDSKKAKSDDDETDASKKKVAMKDDDDVSVDKKAEPGGSAAALSPATRAVDAVFGVSFMARKLTFNSTLQMNKPIGYNQTLLPGGYVDATFFPLGFSHSGGFTSGLGLNVLFDRVIKVSAQQTAMDGTKVQMPITEQRYRLGAVVRFPFGAGAAAGLTVGYGKESFTIDRGTTAVDIPNTNYTVVDPGAMLRYPLGDKLSLNVDAGVMLILKAGEIANADQYGTASVLGFEGDLGLDYMVGKNLFVRAGGRFETVGFTFKGTGMLSNSRDGDATSQDVFGARDTHFGAQLTLGYAY